MSTDKFSTPLTRALRLVHKVGDELLRYLPHEWRDHGLPATPPGADTLRIEVYIDVYYLARDGVALGPDGGNGPVAAWQYQGNFYDAPWFPGELQGEKGPGATPPEELPPGAWPGHDFDHREAYCLMKYRDVVAGQDAVIWNSRDGVTPFAMTAGDGRRAEHVDFFDDQFEPFHVPAVGDQIWMDETRAGLLAQKRSFVAKHWDGTAWSPPLRDHPEFRGMTQAEAAAAIFEEEWREGMPRLVEVTDELHQVFKQRRAEWLAFGPAVARATKEGVTDGPR